jgi:PAS domain S-box-containing protein
MFRFQLETHEGTQMEPDPPPSKFDSTHSAVLLDSLLGSAPVVVAFVDSERRYLRVSDGLARFHGMPRDVLTGRPVAQILPDLWSHLEPIYARVLDRGETVTNVELQYQHPGQPEPLYWLASYYPVYAEGRIIAAGVILVDITERRRAAAVLHESEKRLAYALDAASEGLWDWNIPTGATYYSPGWIESLGYALEDVPPHISFWESIVHPDDMPRVQQALQAHLKGRTRIYRCENRLRTKSGAYRWTVYRGKVVEWDADGKPLRMVGTDTDITERKRAEEALYRLNATLESRVAARTEELARANRELAAHARELERLLRFKSEFLANMSHELRTPLNSLLILSRLLAGNPDGNLTERQVHYARAIHGSGEDLLQLIDDILDFAKTESGTLSFHYEHVAFSDVIRTLQRTFRHVAEEKCLDFTIETSPALPYSLQTDPMRLRQILTNLLSNAFKFTERGRVSVNIYPASHRLMPPSPGRNVAAFEVSDTGIGIAAEKREIIFEAFRQADTGTDRRYGGTGLGLTICRQLTAQMGGEITLASKPGKGSTFTVYLPMRAEKHGSAVSDGARPPSESGGMDDKSAVASQEFVPPPAAERVQKKILVVDDDPRNRYSLSAALEAERYAVITAASGESALEALDRQPDIDCVLLDIMMPDMDGYETARRIRAQPRFEHLLVIAVTAKAMAEDMQKCMEAGCSEYLSKPVDTTKLLEIIQTLKRNK